MMTSLEAMNTTISNLHNTLSDQKENIYDDNKNDIMNKLNILSKIADGLAGNIEVIENSKGSDKRVLKLKNFVNLIDLTKKLELIEYFYSLKIYGYYEIDVIIEKDYLGIFSAIFIGALEIAGGTFLLWATSGQIGEEFIEEGYNDIKYGINCLLGKEEFSWSKFKAQKLNFLINTAVNIALKLITAGISRKLSKFKPKKSFRSVIKQVGWKMLKKVGAEAGKKVGKVVIPRLIGPEKIKWVFDTIKGILNNNIIDFFGSQLKQLIPDEFRTIMCINVTVYKGENPIQRVLRQQLKVLLRGLSGLVKIFVRLILDLFSSNKSNLINLKNEVLSFLKRSLADSFESLKLGILSEVKGLIEGKNKSNKGNSILSWPEYLKAGKICKTLSEAENLTRSLVENDILSLSGELNIEQISGVSDKKNSNKIIKLNIGFLREPIRNITKSFGNIPQKKIEKMITDFMNDIRNIFEEIIQSLISEINERFENAINFLKSPKNTILIKIKSYKDEIIQNSTDTLNDLNKSIINTSNNGKEFINEKYEYLRSNILNIEEALNGQLKSLRNVFDNFKLHKTKIDKIKKSVLNKLEGLSGEIKKFSNSNLKGFISSLKKFGPLNDSKTIDTISEKAENSIDYIIRESKEKNEEIIKFISEKMDILDKDVLNNYIVDKISIDSEKTKKIIDKLDLIKNECDKINENVENKIIIKNDELIDYIYDLDEKINEKIEKILDKLFNPYEKLIKELKNLFNEIQDKIYEMKNIFIRKLNEVEEKMKKYFENLINKGAEKLGNLIPGEININLKERDESNNNSTALNRRFNCNINSMISKGNNGLKKLNETIKNLQSLLEEMKKYEESSKMDETINILNNEVLSELIRLLVEAFKNSKVGDFIKKAAEELLKGMENTKKNLRGELQNMGAI